MSFPHPFPHAFPGLRRRAARAFFALLREGPPWLQRAFGLRFMRALYTPFDTVLQRTTDGVKKRFPSGYSGASALARIGADRRILRGPGEPPTSYAARLRRWLDDHRGRGGAHALLRQLREYHRASFTGRIDVVSHAGVRYSMIGDVITRDRIEWSADGTTRWAQIWIFFHLPAAPTPLTDAQRESWLAVPRDWSAAHIWRTHVVLLSPGAELWGYPNPVGPWNDPFDALWDVPGDPTQLVIEG